MRYVRVVGEVGDGPEFVVEQVADVGVEAIGGSVAVVLPTVVASSQRLYGRRRRTLRKVLVGERGVDFESSAQSAGLLGSRRLVHGTCGARGEGRSNAGTDERKIRPPRIKKYVSMRGLI